MIERELPQPRDIERKNLQDRLAAVDHDIEKLQDLMAQLYTEYPQNPQIFYMAGAQLTALSYLDYRIDRSPNGDKPEIPTPQDSLAAFSSYTRLIAELGKELHSPGPQEDMETIENLLGVRDELVWDGSTAYATAHGADFLSLPTPASLDFGGGRQASDKQIFFPLSDREKIDAQIKLGTNINREVANYDSRIAILSLSGILGKEKAIELRGLLKGVGERDDPVEELPQTEHEIIMDAAGAMVAAAHEWVEGYEQRKAA